MAIQLHKDGEGVLILSDEGHPMIVREEGGTPEAFDITAAMSRISTFGSEKQKLQGERDGAVGNLKPWEALGKTPEEVSDAFKRLDGLNGDEADLATAVAAADAAGYSRGTDEHKKSLVGKQERITALESERFKDRVRQAISQSKVVATRLVESWRHADEAEGLLAEFAREDDEGRIYFVDRKGTRIVSEKAETLGDPADREESFLHLLKTHPRADIIMCADVGGGGGSEDGKSGQKRGQFTISRAARREGTQTMNDVRRIKKAADKAGAKVNYVDYSTWCSGPLGSPPGS